MASEWRAMLDGRPIAHRSTRQAAMNFLDKPWKRGDARVRNERTGEEWVRRGGSWYPAHSRTAEGGKARAVR